MVKEHPDERDQDLVRLYLDEIGKYPLLTKDDEVRLAKAIEAGRAARAELGSGADHSIERRRELEQLAADGEQAITSFVNSNLRLVVSIAKRYQSVDMPLLDRVQEGNLGLMHAVEKFDWRRGFKFSTYATWWIRQAIGRGIDNTSRTIRLPVGAGDLVRRVQRVRASLEADLGRSPTLAELAAEVGVTEQQLAEIIRFSADTVSLAAPIGDDGESELGEIVADPTASSPFDVVAEQMVGGEIKKLLDPLDERERQILRLRYGLDRGEPRTLDEIGDVLQLTRERIRQLEKAAIAKLRQTMGSEARELLAS